MQGRVVNYVRELEAEAIAESATYRLETGKARFACGECGGPVVEAVRPDFVRCADPACEGVERRWADLFDDLCAAIAREGRDYAEAVAQDKADDQDRLLSFERRGDP